MSTHLTSVPLSVSGSPSHPVGADEMAAHNARQGVVTMLKDSAAFDSSADAPQLKNEILAMVAHELRGPLTPLRFASQMIRTALSDRPDIHRLIDMIDRQVSEIERLTQDLMDATRVDQGALRLSTANIEIVAALADAFEMTAVAAAAKGQTFTMLIPDRALRVEGDPVRLTQAVSNLLHNAVKYTPVHGDIRMTVFAEGIDLVIKVHDNGLGISAVLLPHIFDLFAQSSRTIAASAGGLGIGLAVVKAIAESHGGIVSATSGGPGAGSEFTLRLPIVARHRTLYGCT